MNRSAYPVWIALLVAAMLPAFGDAELVLVDGQVLRGTDVRRDGGVFILTTEDGGEVTLPVELIEEVRLIEEEKYVPEGLTDAEPEVLAGRVPEGPSGFRVAEPQTLAGERVEAPRTSDQLEVFGEPSGFQKDIVDNDWVPSSDWDMDPANNNFAPSTWAEGPVDSDWEPESAWDANENVLESGRSSFQKSIIDNSWKPKDAFADD